MNKGSSKTKNNTLKGNSLTKGGGGGYKRLARVKTRDQCGMHDMETCSLLFVSLL